MAITLQLTNGTTTLDLANGSAYALPYDEWSPAVSTLRTSTLAGISPYDDVLEEIPLHVRGATGAAALGNLSALIQALEQAERANRGEAVTAWRIKYLPHNTSLGAALEARILGGVGENRNLLKLSPRVNDAGNYEIPGVRLRLWRQGEWKNPTAASTNASGGNGSKVYVTVASTKAWSPTKVTVTNVLANPSLPAGFIVFADGGILIGDANSYIDTATDYTTQAEAGTNASGGNLRRFTPTATSERLSGASPTFLVSNITWFVLISARNNSATTSFRLRVWLDPVGGGTAATPFASTPSIVIPANAGNPTWYPVGILPKMNTSEANCYSGVGITASAAAGSMDIDKICFIAAEYWFHVVKFYSTQVLASSPGLGTLTLDHRVLTSPDPKTSMNVATNIVLDGSPAIWTPAVPSFSNNLDCALLATGGYSGATITPNYWGQYNIGGGAALSNTWTLERMASYLIPE